MTGGTKAHQARTRHHGRMLLCALAAALATTGCSATRGTEPSAPAGFYGRVEPAAPMTTDRAAHRATLLADGTVLITGGITAGELGLDSAERYDPATDAFRPTGRMISVRAGGHAAIRLRDGQVLVAGGWAGSVVTATAELYDPRTGRFTRTGSMRTARTDMAAALLTDGTVLLAGGYDGRTALAAAEIYDPADGTFHPTGSLAMARTSVAGAVLPGGRVLVAGGQGTGTTVLASAEVYDPATGAWQQTDPMTTARYKAGATALPGGKVLVLGGSDARDWAGQYRTAEVFDPATNRFRPTAEPMRADRFKIVNAVASLADGTVVVAGSDALVETYDPIGNRFRPARGQLDGAYQFATATTLADGRVLIAGGYPPDIKPTAHSWLFSP